MDVVTDIVERFPTTAGEAAEMDKRDLANACIDAVEEIKRLRAALQTAADALQEAGCTYAWAGARAALMKGRHD